MMLDGAGPAMSSLMKKAPEFRAFAQGASTIQNRDGLADSAFISSGRAIPRLEIEHRPASATKSDQRSAWMTS
jgi:hypothetical protein